jgi:hypothetical protein
MRLRGSKSFNWHLGLSHALVIYEKYSTGSQIPAIPVNLLIQIWFNRQLPHSVSTIYTRGSFILLSIDLLWQ